MSFSVGLMLGNLRLMRTAILTVLIGVLIGLVVALASGVIVPLDTSTPEMLARGRPSLLDMGVALASGAAGAYAMARKDIPAALVGVAIAAALVPPLCTLGLALSFREFPLASGAALLFLTNIVSIGLAGSAVLAWLGLSPAREHHPRRQVAISLVILLLLALPLASTLIDVIRVERQTTTAHEVLQQQFHDADIIDVQLNGNKVTATIRSPNMITQQDVRAAEQTLQRDLGSHVTLEITYWQSIKPSD
jgi:uncharacterized hydrophobic protein (TIGR00271 family)